MVTSHFIESRAVLVNLLLGLSGLLLVSHSNNDHHILFADAFQPIQSNTPSVPLSIINRIIPSISSSSSSSSLRLMDKDQQDIDIDIDIDIDATTKTTNNLSRRNVFQSIIAAVPIQYLAVTSIAATNTAVNFNANAYTYTNSAESSTALPNGLLESRVLENVLSPPPYGIESSDIVYPSYFNGVWDVDSKTSEIIAPCGIALFGGNYTYTKAQKEIGTSLIYKSRFIPTTGTITGSTIPTSTSDSSSETASTRIIADREYNVVAIAKSAMGNNAVLDVPLATPNKVSVILSPAGANQIFQADLLTLNRRSEYISSCDFHCSEVVRQIIAPARGSSSGNNQAPQPMAPSRSSSLLKEIETASLYTAIRGDDGSVKEIICRQRSATFLLPSQQDPLTYKMWEMSRGRPIDVRLYDIVYTKRS